MKKQYHNTTEESGETLEKFTQEAKSQDEIVLGIIKKLKKFSPKDVFNGYPSASVPITSIRRSINTHLNKGNIKATGEKVDGLFGRPEKEYKLITQ